MASGLNARKQRWWEDTERGKTEFKHFATYTTVTFKKVRHESNLAQVKLLFIYKHNKAVPLEAWSGPEGSRKLSFPDFMTTAQDVGKIYKYVQLKSKFQNNKTWSTAA